MNEAGTAGPEPQQSDTTDSLEIIDLVPKIEVDPSKTGNKPKQLVAAEVMGYQVGRGLRRRIVNPDDVYKLSALGCTDREIARWWDMDENTLRYNFSEVLEKGRIDIKMNLRRAQLDLALKGNAVMLIWLGKNVLGQSDNPFQAEDEKPLPWQDE
jgi:hypothetical protein